MAGGRSGHGVTAGGPSPLGGPGPWPAPGPGSAACPDPEWESYLAWREREIAAGRCEEPPAPWEIEGPAVSISLGDAADVDPALLAAICSPGGPDGDALGRQFSQGSAGDALRPGPVLAALTEQAVRDLSQLSDNQLFGALHAASRLENRLCYLKTRAIAEFDRRRAAQRADADARGIRPGRRPGERPDAELAAELLISRNLAGDRLAAAAELTSRLPRTLAGMADGLIDPCRADTIAFYTARLSREDAANADQILAELAPTVRAETLARRAAALEMKLDPDAARARRQSAQKERERVEIRREPSGNASVAGRELTLAEALASKANVYALALRLRSAGLPGTLDSLRVTVFNDLLQGRSPLDRIAPPPGAAPATADALAAAGGDGGSGGSGVPPGTGPGSARPDDAPAPGPAPMPAVINLIVRAGTLFGWDTTPSQAAGWGLLDPDDTRAVVRAASLHPQTRWCMTVTRDDGTAVAHGCSAGRHPWDPAGTRGPEPPGGPSGRRPGPGRPGARQAARFADLLRRLNIKFELIAAGSCDHSGAEDRYAPGRKLRHLVRARTATCTAPGCRAQAIYADLDHTVPWPDGPTDQCNLGPKCRVHHRCKESPDWKLEQPEPGVFRWTLPNGRTHLTRPTAYD